VQSHPIAKYFRYAPNPLFDKLAYAFKKDRATGKRAHPPLIMLRRWIKKRNSKIMMRRLK
jgi:hypothetical protein